MEINGVAHVILTVNDFAACVPFYEQMLQFIGLRQIHKRDDYLYYVGGRTAIGITKADPQYSHEQFAQRRAGLHHLCLRARERADIDTFYAFISKLGAKIVHPPEDGHWAPGYYSVLFEDPGGIRIEMNYVPGKGLLA